MDMKDLTKNGPQVSKLGFGCMALTDAYGTADKDEAAATLKRAYEAGINFFDTADVYGGGRNEEFIANVLGNVRDQFVLASKFGFEQQAGRPPASLRGDPDYVRAACEASLKRLRTDYIDLYYLHRVDPKVPIEDTVGAMAKLVQEGKVKYLGLSEISAETLRRAHTVHPITAVQSEYSLISRGAEQAVIPTCEELGVIFVPFSPLGRGMITDDTDKLQQLESRDTRARMPRFDADNLEHNLGVLKGIRKLAAEKGCATCELALAWVMAQGDNIVPIPGAKRLSHLEAILSSADLQLSSNELTNIAAAINLEDIAGARYSEQMMKFTQSN